jgi:hypothetical protein
MFGLDRAASWRARVHGQEALLGAIEQLGKR